MFKLIKKIIDFFSTSDTTYSNEPEFLGEYWVYYGTKCYTTVYAKSSEDAKRVALATNPCPASSGEIYAIYKRKSNRRNPTYGS